MVTVFLLLGFCSFPHTCPDLDTSLSHTHGQGPLMALGSVSGRPDPLRPIAPAPQVSADEGLLAPVWTCPHSWRLVSRPAGLSLGSSSYFQDRVGDAGRKQLPQGGSGAGGHCGPQTTLHPFKHEMNWVHPATQAWARLPWGLSPVARHHSQGSSWGFHLIGGNPW